MGHALGLLRGYSGLTREMVFLSTKAGFLSKADVDGLLQSRAMDAGDLVQGMHCLHPACLDFSLKRSLARMNVGTVRLRPVCGLMACRAAVTGRDGCWFTKACEASKERPELHRTQPVPWSTFMSTMPPFSLLNAARVPLSPEEGASSGVRT